MTNEVELCLASGMDFVLGKPILTEDLRRMLIQWLPAARVTSSEPGVPANV